MTPQEQQLLQDFLKQLTQVRGIPKEPQAELLIKKAIAEQPDAEYLLVQRVMLLEQALNSAKAQIVELQNQAAANVNSGSFLSAAGWGPTPTPAPLQGGLNAAAPANRSGFLNSGAGSFLGTLAATAAG